MTPLLETAGWSLIHFVWQGCAIAASPPPCCSASTEQRSASVRYAMAVRRPGAMIAAPVVTGACCGRTPATVSSADSPACHERRARRIALTRSASQIRRGRRDHAGRDARTDRADGHLPASSCR